MIIFPHLIVGAVIGAKTHNLGLIIILGLLSHWIMDRIPHWDYNVSKNIDDFKNNKKIKGLLSLFLKIFIDGFIGILIIMVLAVYQNLFNAQSLIFIFWGMFFSVLPDIILTIMIIFGQGKFSQKYIEIHDKYFHIKSEKEGKITFLGLLTQIVVIIGALIGFFV